MQNELDIARDVATRLESGGVDYMLTGSMAMSFYALPRMTRDIDIVLEIEPQNADALAGLFEADYYVSREAIISAIRSESLFNFLHLQTLIKVDFIVRKSLPYRRIEFARRQRISIKDFCINVVSKEDLIISKLWWARDSRSETQFRDIRNLVLSGSDLAYVAHWVKELDLIDAWREVNA